jgi:hypothetical protein
MPLFRKYPTLLYTFLIQIEKRRMNKLLLEYSMDGNIHSENVDTL